MMRRLHDKTALILGADPISIGIATRYIAEGASVVLAADEEALAAAGIPPGVTSLEISAVANEADKIAIQTAAGASLDILVLGGEDVPTAENWSTIAELTLDRFRSAQDRMVARSLVTLQACEAALKTAGNSSIIFLFSPTGFYSDGGWGDRTMAYHARHGLMRAVGSEWGPVRANMLVPFADTPGFQAFRMRNATEVDLRVSTTAMRRVGDPVKDIGGAAVFLGSDDTQFVNGMIVYADGGAHLTAPVIETKMDIAE